MSETPTALRVQAATIPDGEDATVQALLMWADTAAKLMGLAAEELEQMQRDHIGAHRTSVKTVSWLESLLEKATAKAERQGANL